MDIFKKKKLTWLDVIFGVSLLAVLLVLIINIFLQSIYLIYCIIIVVLAVLYLTSRKFRKKKDSLPVFWLLALLSIFLYPFFDYLLAVKLRLVDYLTSDPTILLTPIYIFLYWIFGILLFGYCYLRIQGLTEKKWLASLSAGMLAGLSALVVENLFNAMSFYSNTPSYGMIYYIPLYIPLGYLLVFSFIPLYIRYKYLFGFLLYGITSLAWVLSYHLIGIIGRWLS